MQELQELIKSIIPVRTEAVIGGTAGGTLVTILFGQWNNLLQALAMFMLLDYITGVMAAYMRPRARLSSKKGLKGIIKKMALILLVVFAHYLDLALGQNVFMVLVVYTLLGNEGLSVIENLSYCGAPVPTNFKNKLEQLAQDKAIRRGSDDGRKS